MYKELALLVPVAVLYQDKEIGIVTGVSAGLVNFRTGK